MNTEENKKQEVLTDEQLDNVAGGAVRSAKPQTCTVFLGNDSNNK